MEGCISIHLYKNKIFGFNFEKAYLSINYSQAKIYLKIGLLGLNKWKKIKIYPFRDIKYC